MGIVILSALQVASCKLAIAVFNLNISSIVGELTICKMQWAILCAPSKPEQQW